MDRKIIAAAGSQRPRESVTAIRTRFILQVPDVLVYLCEGGTRTGFARFKASILLARGFELSPSWHRLHPTKPIGRVGPKTPPMASLLLSLCLGLKEEASTVHWPPAPPLLPTRSVLKPYEVRLHLCMGKDLPAK